MTINEETAKFLSKRLTLTERRELKLSEKSITWAGAIAKTLIKKAAGGDMNAIKLVKELTHGENQSADTVITVQVVE